MLVGGVMEGGAHSVCVCGGRRGVQEINTLKDEEGGKKRKRKLLPLQHQMREHNYQRLAELTASAAIKPSASARYEIATAEKKKKHHHPPPNSAAPPPAVKDVRPWMAYVMRRRRVDV